MKKVLKVIGIIVGAIVALAVLFILLLTVTEYKPDAVEPADQCVIDDADPVSTGETLKIVSWNIGYAGLDASQDFIMDGGEGVMPEDQAEVDENLAAFSAFLKEQDADIYMLQEVDRSSHRTFKTDELERISAALYGDSSACNWAYGINYKCMFVPFPMPPWGKVLSGVATLTDIATADDAVRVDLPTPFKWPVRAANLNRCLLVTRYAVEGTDAQLVVVNQHLEAYSSDEGREAQMKVLMDFIENEYAAGNYVIAGGDFNQNFPGADEAYPLGENPEWIPGHIEYTDVPEGWCLAFDLDMPSCRSLDIPYDSAHPEANVYYVIDGFILSPNVELKSIEGNDLKFQNSDHNPQTLEIVLK